MLGRGRGGAGGGPGEAALGLRFVRSLTGSSVRIELGTVCD